MPRRKAFALGYVIGWYLKRCQGQACRLETMRWYKQKLQAFQAFLGQSYGLEDVTQIAEKHVIAFLASLNVSEATKRGYGQVLYSFFRWCVYKDFIGSNPAQQAVSNWRKKQDVAGATENRRGAN